MGKPRAKNFFYALAEEAAHSDDRQDSYSKKLFEQAPKYNLLRWNFQRFQGRCSGLGVTLQVQLLLLLS